METAELFRPFLYAGKIYSLYTGNGTAPSFPAQADDNFYCMQDKDTPKFVKLALMGALGYVILPLDLVSDAFIGIGWLDDAAVVAAALRLAGTYVKPEHLEKVRRMFPFANV